MTACLAPEPVRIPLTSPARSARALADAYLRYETALWQGVPCAPAFGEWLASCWSERMPARPAAGPVAVSPHGAGGRGISWYDVGGVTLGYVPGSAGGYRIPAGMPPARPSMAGQSR